MAPSSDEKFCLSYNNFQANSAAVFQELRQNEELFDVTLACGDGEQAQVQAHKLVLAASSAVFRGIMRSHPHPHPIIYLNGVKLADLLLLMDFMYQGKAVVAMKETESFLRAGKELRVKGLGEDGQESDLLEAPSPASAAPYTPTSAPSYPILLGHHVGAPALPPPPKQKGNNSGHYQSPSAVPCPHCDKPIHKNSIHRHIKTVHTAETLGQTVAVLGGEVKMEQEEQKTVARLEPEVKVEDEDVEEGSLAAPGEPCGESGDLEGAIWGGPRRYVREGVPNQPDPRMIYSGEGGGVVDPTSQQRYNVFGQYMTAKMEEGKMEWKEGNGPTKEGKMVWKEGKTTWECTICGKYTGAIKHDVMKHVENVHVDGGFSYHCRHCAEVFDTRTKMQHHERRKHTAPSARRKEPSGEAGGGQAAALRSLLWQDYARTLGGAGEVARAEEAARAGEHFLAPRQLAGGGAEEATGGEEAEAGEEAEEGAGAGLGVGAGGNLAYPKFFPGAFPFFR